VFRTILVVAMLAGGWAFALQSPLYAACLYLWIAYFRPESWAWNDIFVTLNLSYLAGVFLVLRALAGGVRFRIDARSALLLAFLLHSVLSAAMGFDSAYSMANWWDFAKVIVVSVLLTNIIRTPGDLRLVLIVISLSLGFEAVKQGWAQLILNPGARNDNIVPFLGDNNLVAVGMAMLIPIIAALAETSAGWRKRAWQLANVGVIYRALSTYSRGGFLSIGAVSTIWFWRSPHKLRTLAAVVIAAALILPVMPQQFWDRMSTITATSDGRDSSQQSRLHFWQVAAAMANDRPLFGIGHKGYERAYNQYDWTGGQFQTDRAVHSVWFGVVAELGYPGLMLFILIVFGSLRSCRRVRKAAERGEIPAPLGHYAIAFETSLVAFMVGGSFVSFQYNEMLWHYFALTIALERVAVAEAALSRAPREEAVPAFTAPASESDRDSDRDFAWT
jgi:probable O-glycosylation ligase (exosortase A-associated)